LTSRSFYSIIDNMKDRDLKLATKNIKKMCQAWREGINLPDDVRKNILDTLEKLRDRCDGSEQTWVVAEQTTSDLLLVLETISGHYTFEQHQLSLKQMQNHHIVPDYWCKSKKGQLKLKELGLTTSYKVDGKEFYFKENLVRVVRKQHALIHWGYWTSDLSALLEVCSPPQWVLDMIPLGNKKDSGAAVLIALNEVEGIVPLSGKDNPNYKHGKTVGKSGLVFKKYMCERQKKYAANPKNMETIIAYRDNPVNRAHKRALDKKYREKPENKARNKVYQKEWRARKKLEKVTTTLDKFL